MAQQTDVRSGVHTLVNQANGLVVDNGSSTAQNTGVIQWQWNVASSLALDDDSKSANGTPLIEWAWQNASNQKWYLK